jgi:hypothetical protein
MNSPRTCIIPIKTLFGVTCCGRPATLYDRARKDWICSAHHRERLCEFCQSEPAWARVRPHIHGVYCEVWLCRDCLGMRYPS